MVERFRNLTEEQLNIGIAIMSASCLVLLFLFGLLMTTEAGANLLVAANLAPDEGRTAQPTATLSGEALPPTWTPRPTNTATPTNTPPPTDTPAPTATETPPSSPTAEISPTPEPDFAATIAAAQSATPPPPPPAPVIQPTPVPPPVIQPPVVQPAPPTAIPPTPLPPTPIPTPPPLYVLSELLGGPNCGYSGIGGTVRNVNGAPMPGVTLEIFNEFGYTLTPVTDANGRYEAFLDSRPREDLAGPWHIRIREGEAQVSNEIVVIMSGSCTVGETQFVADFYRTR